MKEKELNREERNKTVMETGALVWHTPDSPTGSWWNI